MKLFDNTSIQTKLKLVILSTSVLTLVLIFTGFFTYEHITYKKILLNDVTTKADIIAENSNAALAFRDSADAARVLASLTSQPRVTAAAIYDSDGKLFAAYVRTGERELFPSAPQSERSQFGENALIAFKPIRLNGNQIGTLYLSSDLLGQQERFWSYLQIAALVFIGSLTVAYAVASILAKNISAPLTNLAETVRQVSEHQDYSVRASVATNDETGLLANTFNQMLVRIYERDADLRKSNEALQNAEKRYRTTLDNMQEGCQIINFDFYYIYLNEVAASQGHSSKEKLIGHKMMEVYPGIENTKFFEILRQCMDQRTTHSMENEFTYADGTTGWFDLRIEPVPEGAFILSTDITKERDLQQQLNKYREHLEDLVKERTSQLEIANKELEAFSYSVSHDLRAPLRHIDGFSELLRKHAIQALDEKGHRFLTTISDAAKQMGVLIDELLVFSRMGRVEMRSMVVHPKDIIREVIESMPEETQGRTITWNIEPLPNIEADPSMLKLVFQNLIGNALKYTRPREKPEITIGSMTKVNDIVFYVRDNGVGFDMGYVDKLFGVFQRLHRAEEFEGTGIGLANVRRIIYRHGGKTWAEGEVNKGATFYFSFPHNRKE